MVGVGWHGSRAGEARRKGSPRHGLRVLCDSAVLATHAALFVQVYNYWGFSPPLDLSGITAEKVLQDAALPAPAHPSMQLLLSKHSLQIGSGDARHTLYTLAHIALGIQSTAEAPSPSADKQATLCVWEGHVSILARHMLQVAILFDQSLSCRERAHLLLEVHGRNRTRPRAVRAQRAERGPEGSMLHACTQETRWCARVPRSTSRRWGSSWPAS